MQASVASVGWTPSLARTAFVVEPSGTQLRGLNVATVPLFWPAKAPVEQLDYTLDISAWLADSGDQLETFNASVSPAIDTTDLGIIWATIIGGNPTIFVGGGTQAVAYVVLLEVETVEGRIAVFSVSLPVSTATPSTAPPPPLAAPPNAIASSAGLLSFDNNTLLLLS